MTEEGGKTKHEEEKERKNDKNVILTDRTNGIGLIGGIKCINVIGKRTQKG